MKDQLALLKKCIMNEIPAVVISGRDICSVPVLRCYLEEANKQGCDPEFIADFNLVLSGFIKFQQEEPGRVEKPNL